MNNNWYWQTAQQQRERENFPNSTAMRASVCAMCVLCAVGKQEFECILACDVSASVHYLYPLDVPLHATKVNKNHTQHTHGHWTQQVKTFSYPMQNLDPNNTEQCDWPSSMRVARTS